MGITIRVKYMKGEEVKYVGHLDTMRTFMRCLRMTNIPVEYSKGFNPRIKISFALPLGVGVTSDSEYFDLELEEKMNKEIFLGEMNSVLPQGFKALSAEYPDNNKSLMSLVKEAIYEIKIEDDVNMDLIKNLFEKAEVCIEKESKDKKTVEQKNIKENIIDFNVEGNICTFHVTAGSVNNLNPNSIIEAINAHVQRIDNYEVNRKSLILVA